MMESTTIIGREMTLLAAEVLSRHERRCIDLSMHHCPHQFALQHLSSARTLAGHPIITKTKKYMIEQCAVSCADHKSVSLMLPRCKVCLNNIQIIKLPSFGRVHGGGAQTGKRVSELHFP